MENQDKWRKQMLLLLRDYEPGQIKLGRLVDDLDAIFSQIDRPASAFKASFLKQWGMLEDVRALRLDSAPAAGNLHEDKVLASVRTLISLLEGESL